jgi:hypothetical protein
LLISIEAIAKIPDDTQSPSADDGARS